MSHVIHEKAQWYSLIYLASIFFLTLTYLVLIAKRKQIALIIATSLLLLGNSIGVCYAYSLLDAQKDTWHAWLKAHMKWNNAFCAIACLCYNYAMYILIIKQWIASYQICFILGPGVQKKLKISDDTENPEFPNEPQEF